MPLASCGGIIHHALFVFATSAIPPGSKPSSYIFLLSLDAAGILGGTRYAFLGTSAIFLRPVTLFQMIKMPSASNVYTIQSERSYPTPAGSHNISIHYMSAI